MADFYQYQDYGAEGVPDLVRQFVVYFYRHIRWAGCFILRLSPGCTHEVLKVRLGLQRAQRSRDLLHV